MESEARSREPLWRADAHPSTPTQAARGPPVTGPPERRGFGSQLIETTALQLGGSARWAWPPEGLRCDLRIPAGSFDTASKPAAPLLLRTD